MGASPFAGSWMGYVESVTKRIQNHFCLAVFDVFVDAFIDLRQNDGRDAQRYGFCLIIFPVHRFSLR
jgi:hypothetical protein